MGEELSATIVHARESDHNGGIGQGQRLKVRLNVLKVVIVIEIIEILGHAFEKGNMRTEN